MTEQDAIRQQRKKTSIGGQALIEGIMMRGPAVTAMAVRHTSGNIVLEQWDTAASKSAVRKLPFVRGVLNMVSSMKIGFKCLMRSAELSGLDEDGDGTPAAEPVGAAEEGVEPGDGAAAAVMPAKGAKESEKFWFTLVMVFSVILGVGLAVGLFMVLPTFLYSWTADRVTVLKDNRWTKSVFEGLMRIALFLGYVSLVSLMKDIKRVFMYHGAEHKCIFCYEAGEALTVENVRRQRRFHPRCGTSFLVLMLLVGIFISMLIPPVLVADNAMLNNLLRIGIKILMLPLVVGLGYELIKLAGRRDNWFTRLISKPGMWMQKITTKEPDDGMIECAIQALEAVIPADGVSDNW